MHPFPNVMCGTRRLVPTVFSTTGNAALSNGNLTVTESLTGSTFGGALSTFSATAGKFYAEFLTLTSDAGSNIGLAKAAASLTVDLGGQAAAAISQISSGGGVYVGGSAGSVSPAGGGSAGAGTRWDVAVDLDNDRLWFRTAQNPNPAYWNNSSSADPATNSGGIDISSWRSGAAVFMVAQAVHQGSGWTANFGQNVFGGVVPSGFNQGFGAI